MEFANLIQITKLDGVVLRSPHQENIDGTLCISGHHLILSSRKEGVKELWLLHKNIDHIEKKENKPGPNGSDLGGSIILKCKDLRILQLDIVSTPDLIKVSETLEDLKNETIANMRLQYPYFYTPMFKIIEGGYTMYNVESEYAKILNSDKWRLTRINQEYSVCSSYSKLVVVPASVNDDCIVASASFRQGGRFPVLSYRHENGAFLLRAGQPLCGSQGRRCRQDEQLLNAVLGPGKKGLIFDLRSPSLVAQQKSKGGGIESDSHYSQWKKVNRSMDKVDNLQLLDSFSKLVEVCNDKDVSVDKWLSKLESGGWLEHVLSALNTACTVAQCLHQDGNPVLVHGTKGQDATLVVCSLVQIILNPDCRTIKGLQALIEREWLQAGHPFSTRHRHSVYYRASPAGASSLRAPPPPAGAAPTFALLLDCCRQLLEQFPCSFEFTQQLLVELFEHSYQSQFGTFLGDDEHDRTENKVYTDTWSLWSSLNQPNVLAELLNPLYEPTNNVIWPTVAPVSLVIWEELYLRWVIDQTPLHQVNASIAKIKQRDQELRSCVVRMRKELLDLAQAAAQQGIQNLSLENKNGSKSDEVFEEKVSKSVEPRDSKESIT